LVPEPQMRGVKGRVQKAFPELGKIRVNPQIYDRRLK
jgi:hypothetical protein